MLCTQGVLTFEFILIFVILVYLIVPFCQVPRHGVSRLTEVSLFKHHIGVMSENLQHKLDLVIEGQQMIGEKVDRLETRMDRLETKADALEVKVDALEIKVDAVAADLSAHRAGTEAHHGVYRVKEERSV